MILMEAPLRSSMHVFAYMECNKLKHTRSIVPRLRYPNEYLQVDYDMFVIQKESAYLVIPNAEQHGVTRP